MGLLGLNTADFSRSQPSATSSEPAPFADDLEHLAAETDFVRRTLRGMVLEKYRRSESSLHALSQAEAPRAHPYRPRSTTAHRLAIESRIALSHQRGVRLTVPAVCDSLGLTAVEAQILWLLLALDLDPETADLAALVWDDLSENADRVADAVVAGQSAEGILAEVAKPGQLDRSAQRVGAELQFERTQNQVATPQTDPQETPQYRTARRQWLEAGKRAAREAKRDAVEVKHISDQGAIDRLVLIAVIKAVRPLIQRYASGRGNVHPGCKYTSDDLIAILQSVQIRAEKKADPLGHSFVLLSQSKLGITHADVLELQKDPVK